MTFVSPVESVTSVDRWAVPLGQVQGAPASATAMPSTVKCGALLAGTLPPWLVRSPTRMTRFLMKPYVLLRWLSGL
ncbi:hypothetical protein IA69_07665 [Massilia sp. JS1662]|nr:hypothetical protein IA69_07665 [Massilia sp. JS1662]